MFTATDDDIGRRTHHFAAARWDIGFVSRLFDDMDVHMYDREPRYRARARMIHAPAPDIADACPRLPPRSGDFHR